VDLTAISTPRAANPGDPAVAEDSFGVVAEGDGSSPIAVRSDAGLRTAHREANAWRSSQQLKDPRLGAGRRRRL
jgi:hypothetical protein